MNNGTKNKLLTWLVVLLLIANAATITMFWLGKRRQEGQSPKGTPQNFLVSELKLDAKQQEQLNLLVKEHRQAVGQLREKIKGAKDHLFDLIKETNVTDSVKKSAAAAVSVITEEIDLLTLNHFQQVRKLCMAEQQQKFDEIIHQVTSMMGQQRPMRPGGPGGPPPRGLNGERPPPPDGEKMPPPEE